MDSKYDSIRQQMLEVIYDFWDLTPEQRYPEIKLNHDCGISGDDAMELILECEKFLGAPSWVLEGRFPFDTYFDPEVGPIWEQILGGFLMPFFILYFFYYLIKKIIFWLLKIKIKKVKPDYDNGKPALTAIAFVNIMIDLWKKYQTEQKDDFGY